MTKDEIIKALRDMARYPTVTLPRDSEALKVAADLLAQPEQEPVAWMSPSWIDPDTRGWQSDSFEAIPIEGWLPLYTTPSQRKPLTNGEIYMAYITATDQTLRPQDERLAFAFARAIEAAHGIKENT